ncbi:MAG: hypothetical protein AAGF07_03485 [Patescibacteria group bacterium]
MTKTWIYFKNIINHHLLLGLISTSFILLSPAINVHSNPACFAPTGYSVLMSDSNIDYSTVTDTANTSVGEYVTYEDALNWNSQLYDLRVTLQSKSNSGTRVNISGTGNSTFFALLVRGNRAPLTLRMEFYIANSSTKATVPMAFTFTDIENYGSGEKVEVLNQDLVSYSLSNNPATDMTATSNSANLYNISGNNTLFGNDVSTGGISDQELWATTYHGSTDLVDFNFDFDSSVAGIGITYSEFTNTPDNTIVNCGKIELDLIDQVADTNNNGNIGDAGDTINYQYIVKNIGGTELFNISISDPNMTISGSQLASLSAGSTNSSNFTAQHIITTTDVTNGSVSRSSTVTSVDAQNTTFSDLSDDPDDPNSFDDPTITTTAAPQDPPYLVFNIRDQNDTTNLNTCYLGIASAESTQSCSYRLKIETNSDSGFTIFMRATGQLTSIDHNINDALSGAGSSSGSDISNSTLGIEKYGTTITPGSITSGQSIALNSEFDAGNTNAVKFSQTSNMLLLTANGQNLPTTPDTINTTMITHKLNISNITPAGSYSQNITYTVAASF